MLHSKHSCAAQRRSTVSCQCWPLGHMFSVDLQACSSRNTMDGTDDPSSGEVEEVHVQSSCPTCSDCEKAKFFEEPCHQNHRLCEGSVSWRRRRVRREHHDNSTDQKKAFLTVEKAFSDQKEQNFAIRAEKLAEFEGFKGNAKSKKCKKKKQILEMLSRRCRSWSIHGEVIRSRWHRSFEFLCSPSDAWHE